ncbi:hypothetical protein ACFOSD_06765 [Salinispirillum marinum]|uniref:LPP20 lipoprotein n=2 Tax=Saccharospirillaceae TaxID=255527 RepID=A0ABV8BDP2_9GAMM
MRKPYLALSALAIAVLAVGCSNKQTEAQPEPMTRSGVPTWVFTPEVADGRAATGCTPASANISLDSSRADMLARQQLAASMSAQVQALREDYQRRVEATTDGVNIGTSYEEAAREVVDQRLVGARRVTADYVDINGARNFCSMVAVSEANVRAVVEEMAIVTEADPEVMTNAQAFEMFMSQNAMNRLNEALDPQ